MVQRQGDQYQTSHHSDHRRRARCIRHEGSTTSTPTTLSRVTAVVAANRRLASAFALSGPCSLALCPSDSESRCCWWQFHKDYLLLGPRMAFPTTGGDDAALCSSSLDRRRKHHQTLQKEPWKIAQGGLSGALAKTSSDNWTPQQALWIGTSPPQVWG